MGNMRETLAEATHRVLNHDLLCMSGEAVRHPTVHLMMTPEYRNYGDAAIARAEEQLISDSLPDGISFMEETDQFCMRYMSKLHEFVADGDVLIITGGGFLGDLYPAQQKNVEYILSEFPGNDVILMPQTIYYADKEKCPWTDFKARLSTRKRYMVYAREGNTFRFLTRDMGLKQEKECSEVPDCALYLRDLVYRGAREGIGVCFRNDIESAVNGTKIEEALEGIGLGKVSTISTVGDMRIPISRKSREKKLTDLIDELRTKKLIVTDRLHGMLLSVITGTPCIVFDNSSRKVSGVYSEWLQGVESVHFASSGAEALLAAEDLENVSMEHLCTQIENRIQLLRDQEFIIIEQKIRAFLEVHCSGR